MKSTILSATALCLVSSGCLDFRVEVPVSNFSYKQSDADAQMRKALQTYLPAAVSLGCERSALAFLLETTVPIDPNIAIPLKIRSDTVKAEEYANGAGGCVDVDATSFLSEKVQMAPKIARVLKLRPAGTEDTDCQDKLSDPKKTQADTIWLSITGNTLNADISAGRVYYATREISEDELSKAGLAQLVENGTLTQFASFDAIPSGTNKELELPIEESQKAEITRRIIARNIDIVISTDDFVFKQIIDRGHGYLEPVSGEVNIDLSAIVVTSVSFLDLTCLDELPKRSAKVH